MTGHKRDTGWYSIHQMGKNLSIVILRVLTYGPHFT